MLRSNVNLHVEDDAVVAFSRDPAAYLPAVFTRFEGIELMNYSPFIYAFEQTDVAVTGSGTLDGQADADHWWPWKANGERPAAGATDAAVRRWSARGVPVAERVFGDGGLLRPNFIQPYRCTNVLIEGVTIVNSPMWEIHPVLCTNVTVRGVNDPQPRAEQRRLRSRVVPRRADRALHVRHRRRLHRDQVGPQRRRPPRSTRPIENVIVRDCEMKDGHGGVTIGSEISGGARNIFAEHCRMDSPHLDRALRFKTNAVRGGVIEHVYDARRHRRRGGRGDRGGGLLSTRKGDHGGFTPVLRDVDVRNVTSKKSRYAFLLKGYARSPIRDVRVSDCAFDNVASPDVLEHVRDLVLARVRVNGQQKNERISR